MDESNGNDLQALRDAWPEFSIGTLWQARASGPDSRRYIAVKDSIVLSAWTAADLDAAIRREEGQ